MGLTCSKHDPQQSGEEHAGSGPMTNAKLLELVASVRKDDPEPEVRLVCAVGSADGGSAFSGLCSGCTRPCACATAEFRGSRASAPKPYPHCSSSVEPTLQAAGILPPEPWGGGKVETLRLLESQAPTCKKCPKAAEVGNYEFCAVHRTKVTTDSSRNRYFCASFCDISEQVSAIFLSKFLRYF